MYRLHTVVVIAFLIISGLACDPSPSKEIGVLLTDSNQIKLHYAPCERIAKPNVVGITLYRVVGQVIGDTDDEILWNIRAKNSSPERVFIIGVVPEAFQETVSLHDYPDSGRFAVTIDSERTKGETSIAFDLEHLRSNKLLTDRDQYVSLSKFNSQPHCNP
jgi:hypothetical protein